MIYTSLLLGYAAARGIGCRLTVSIAEGITTNGGRSALFAEIRYRHSMPPDAGAVKAPMQTLCLLTVNKESPLMLTQLRNPPFLLSVGAVSECRPEEQTALPFARFTLYAVGFMLAASILVFALLNNVVRRQVHFAFTSSLACVIGFLCAKKALGLWRVLKARSAGDFGLEVQCRGGFETGGVLHSRICPWRGNCRRNDCKTWGRDGSAIPPISNGENSCWTISQVSGRRLSMAWRRSWRCIQPSSQTSTNWAPCLLRQTHYRFAIVIPLFYFFEFEL